MPNFYRKIESEDQGSVALRCLAIQALAKELGLQVIVEAWTFGLNTLLWSRIVRVMQAESPTPFKELLEASDETLYAYLREFNDKWLAERATRLGRAK